MSGSLARHKDILIEGWQRKGQIPVSHVCIILSYSQETVRKMINAKVLDGRGKGSGQRVTVASVLCFLAGEVEWPVSEKHVVKKARAITGTTRRTSGTSGRLSVTASGTASPTATKRRRVFDLKS